MNEPSDREAEAVAWFTYLRSNHVTDERRDRFRAWAEDEANRLEYEAISRLWDGIEPLRRSWIRQRWQTWERSRGSAWWHGGSATAIASLAACACLLVVGVLRWAHTAEHLSPSGDGTPLVELATELGERRTVLLRDGSVLTLDTDSKVSIRNRADARRVVLQRGRISIAVARDQTSPFVVVANGKSITALGTRFDVALWPGELEVSLLEGHVAVQVENRRSKSSRAAPAPVLLVPGQRLVAQDAGPWRLETFDTTAQRAWLKGQLVFNQTRVKTIVEQVNRYSRRKLLIADPAINDKRLSAVLVAGDTDTLAGLLEGMGIARVVAEQTELIKLDSP